MKKKKSLPNRRTWLLKAHFVVFVVFTVGLWWSTISTFYYPGNAAVLLPVYSRFMGQRLSITVLWGLFVLLHFALHELKAAHHRRARRKHLASLKIEHTYDDSRLRLDETGHEDEELFDEAWQDEEYGQKPVHLKRG